MTFRPPRQFYAAFDKPLKTNLERYTRLEKMNIFFFKIIFPYYRIYENIISICCNVGSLGVHCPLRKSKERIEIFFINFLILSIFSVLRNVKRSIFVRFIALKIIFSKYVFVFCEICLPCL